MNPFIGQIVMFGGNFAPRGWALCDGQLLPIAPNTALFSILGTIYGGDGRTTFALPDLRGRTALHPGNGPGLTPFREGQRGGVEQVALNITHLPSHNHTGSINAALNFRNEAGDETSPQGGSLAIAPATAQIYHADAPNGGVFANGTVTGTVSLNNTGGQQAFNIRNPFTAVNFLIALQGVFPSRS